MGVTGLMGELERRGYRPRKMMFGRNIQKPHLTPNLHGTRQNLIVVDGSSLLFKLCGKATGWWYGCVFAETMERVKAFIECVRESGFDMVVVLDGGIDRAKEKEWRSRRNQEWNKYSRLVDAMVEAEKDPEVPPPTELDDKFFSPGCSSGIMGQFFKLNGVRVVTAVGEADKEIAFISKRENAFAVLSSDSDFLPMRAANFLDIQSMVFLPEKGRIIIQCFNYYEVCKCLCVEPNYLRLFCTMCGNDFVGISTLEDFHRKLYNRYNGTNRFENVAHFIRDQAQRGFVRDDWKSQIQFLETCTVFSAHLREEFKTSFQMYSAENHNTVRRSHTDDMCIQENMKIISHTAEAASNVVPSDVFSILYGMSKRTMTRIEDPKRVPAATLFRPFRARIYGIAAMMSEQPDDFDISETCYSVAHEEKYETTVVKPDLKFWESIVPVTSDGSYNIFGMDFESKVRGIFKCFNVPDELADFLISQTMQQPQTKFTICLMIMGCAVACMNSTGKFTENELRALIYQMYIINVPQNMAKLSPCPVYLSTCHVLTAFSSFQSMFTLLNVMFGSPFTALDPTGLFDGHAFHYVLWALNSSEYPSYTMNPDFDQFFDKVQIMSYMQWFASIVLTHSEKAVESE